MWEYTTSAHGLPIGAFFRGESARNAYSRNEDYSITKGSSTVVLALLRDLLLSRLLRPTGHRYRVRLAVENGYGLGKRPRKLVITFSGSPAECGATALDAVVRAGSARSRRAQERRGDGGACRSGKRAATAKLSVGGTLEMFAAGRAFG